MAVALPPILGPFVGSADRAGVHQNAETALSRTAPDAASASRRGVRLPPPGPAVRAGLPRAQPAEPQPMSSPRTKMMTRGGAATAQPKLVAKHAKRASAARRDAAVCIFFFNRLLISDNSKYR